jgi:DNA-binding transcriptional LysR family regulator
MSLSSHELQAFRTVAQTLNFSQAAERIHITQPALSQRIQSLERTLGLTLFIRDRKGVRLTDAGMRLLRYCQHKDHLEEELLADLGMSLDDKLGGRLRVAGYSSIVRSVVMPALAGLLRDNPAVQFEFSEHEVSDLAEVLMRGEADFVVMDHALQQNNVETVVLGQETYVLIRSSQYPSREVYLDHDPADRVTEVFFSRTGWIPGAGAKTTRKSDAGTAKESAQVIGTSVEIPTFTRCYVDSVDGILTGVALGLGQAVMSRHLLSKELPVRAVKGAPSMVVPAVLHYFKQSYYSALQKAAIQTLRQECAKYLK